jgi:hypothetical protein
MQVDASASSANDRPSWVLKKVAAAAQVLLCRTFRKDNL